MPKVLDPCEAMLADIQARVARDTSGWSEWRRRRHLERLAFEDVRRLLEEIAIQAREISYLRDLIREGDC